MPLGHRRPTRSKPAPAVEPAAPQTPVEQAAPKAEPVTERVETVIAYTAAERDEIARIAYFMWEERGGQGGSSEEDWLRAEQEYRRRQGIGR